jgi:polyhydroxyalkanoate synthase
LPADPQQWLDGAELRPGTWWQNWTQWIAERAGPMTAPRIALGSPNHPAMEDAPGSYVRAHSA